MENKDKHEVVILASAQRDLEAIARFHLEWVGPISSKKITDALYSSMTRLEEFPLLGKLIPDRGLAAEGYRILVSGDYLCIYRIVGSSVWIYHIAHKATDYPKLLG